MNYSIKNGFKTLTLAVALTIAGSSILTSAVFASHGQYKEMLSDSAVQTIDSLVNRYEQFSDERQGRIGLKLGLLIGSLNNGTIVVAPSQRAMISNALQYLQGELMAVREDSMMDDSAQEDAVEYLMSDGLMLEMNLGLLLKEHVDLGLNTLRNAYDESDDFQASFDQLDYNTNALAEVLGSVYGDEAEQAFDELWSAHIGFFANYAIGLRDNDRNMRRTAEENLQGYVMDADRFFTDTIPSLNRGDLIAGANNHQSLLLRSLDAYDRGDYEMSYELQREGHKQIGELAHVLAMGIAKQFPDMYSEMDVEAIMSNSGQLKKMLTSTLIEHVTLGLDTLRSAADGSDDFNGAFMALDDNTNMLAEIVGSVYGADAQEAFDTLWTNHIGYFADYTVAVQTNNASMKARAEQDLMQYSIDADDFFSSAIPSIEPGDVMAGASEHKRLLLESIDAYARGDYEDAYRLQHESTMQVTGLGAVLAEGIVRHFPEKFSGLMSK